MSVNGDSSHQPTGMFGRLILFPFVFALCYLLMFGAEFPLPVPGLFRPALVIMAIMAALLLVISRFTSMPKAGLMILLLFLFLLPESGIVSHVVAVIISLVAGLAIGVASRLISKPARLANFPSPGGHQAHFMWLREKLRLFLAPFLVLLIAMSYVTPEPSFPIGLVLGGIVIGFLGGRIRHVPTPGTSMVATLNRGAIMVLALLTALWGMSGRINIDAPATATDCPAGIHSGPNMYVFLLDAHASEGTLARLYDYNLEPFLNGLETDGFYVDRQSHSNYIHTEETLASSLNFQPLQNQSSITASWSQGMYSPFPIRTAILNSAAANLLHCAGYQIAATETPMGLLSMTTADQYINEGQISELEIALLQRLHLVPVINLINPSLFDDIQRTRTLTELSDAVKLAQTPTSTPRFTWVHVLSPHFPPVFVADGPAPVRAGFTGSYFVDTAFELKESPQAYMADYQAQLAYIDKQMLTTEKAIVKADPSAVIMIFSDHGSGAYLDPLDPTKSDLGERFGNLFAVRTPGMSGIYTSPVTPLDMFGILFNAYLGTNISKNPEVDSTWFGPITDNGKITFPQVFPYGTPTP